MTRTVMLEPALLDAKDEAPRQILGAPRHGIDGPMLAAIILSANHGLAEGENDRAMIAGFGRAHFAHDRARLGGGDVTSTLLILMVRIAASIGDGPHDAAGFGERLRFEQFAPFARADEVDGVPPARGGRAGVAVAVGRAVAVDLEAQQTLDMTDIGMICQERVRSEEHTSELQ